MKARLFITSALLLMTCFIYRPSLSAETCWCNMWDHSPCVEDYPYNASRWSASFNGGADPTAFIRQRRVLLFYPSSISGIGFPVEDKATNFESQFYLPWTAGAEIGYMFCDDWEFFVDFSYTAAAARHPKVIDPILRDTYIQSATNYRAYDYHIGTRYFFDTVLCYITPFIGIKLGATSRNKVFLNEEIVDLGVSLGTLNNNLLYDQTTTVSGGGHIGVNWAITCNIALTLKVEALVSGGWKTKSITSPTPNPFDVPVRALGRGGDTMIEVPCTLGMRFSF